MIKIKINEAVMELENVTESWIQEQIKKRQKDGYPICVRIFIKNEFVDMVLSSGECDKYAGGGRNANVNEQRIFDLWGKLHLDSTQLHIGNLIAFLKQVKTQ